MVEEKSIKGKDVIKSKLSKGKETRRSWKNLKIKINKIIWILQRNRWSEGTGASFILFSSSFPHLNPIQKASDVERAY